MTPPRQEIFGMIPASNPLCSLLDDNHVCHLMDDKRVIAGVSRWRGE